MAERRVDFLHVVIGDSFRLEVLLEDLVGRARINVVRTEQVELFLALRQHVIHRRDGLLVHRFGGVKYIFGKFLAFVLDRVEEQAVVLFEDREDRFAAHRSPTAEHDRHLVLFEQLFGLFRKQRPVGRRIHDHRFDKIILAAGLHAARLVDFVKGEQQRVLQRGLADRHRAAERMQHSDLHDVGRARPGQQTGHQ